MAVFRRWLNSWAEQEKNSSEMDEPIEIVRASKILSNEEVTNYYKSVFNCCDTNKDGLISIFELKAFLENQEDVNIPDNILECIYNKFDKNNDKQLDFEEFLEMINNNTFKETFKNLANRVLKFVVVPPKNRKTLKLRRTVTATGTYEKEVKCNKNIVGMAILSILQIICFYTDKNIETHPLRKALIFAPCKRSEIYRYFTYIFLHTDTMHLYGNVIVQIIIGIPLEMIHSWRVLVIYAVGAIGGCLAHSVLDREYNLLGGSGGTFSFFTAHIAAVIMNWREMTHPAVHLLIFGIVVSIDVVYNLVTLEERYSMTSYITHAGGAVVGLLFGVNILRNLRVNKLETIIWFACLVTLTLLFIIFIILDITMKTKCDS